MEGYDQLALSADKGFKKLLVEGQNLLLSCQVTKFNRFNNAQKRNLVITNKGLLNLKGKKMKRRIDLNQIAGTTRAQIGQEFVVHVPSQYDYRYSSVLKNQIIDHLSQAYRQTLNRQMIIWERPEPSLKEFATTKADRKKGVSRIPDPSQGVNFSAIRQQEKGNRGKRSTTIYAAPENSQNVSIQDFQILRVLGRGSFGKVMLVKKLDNNQIYAMKSLRKDALIEKHQVQNTKTQREIMAHINHPYLVKLQYAFSSSDKIYFVMAYMRGGEMFFHLQESRKFTQERARFYAAQIGLGLGHLHSRNIVYRDLKPQNILLDDDGNAHLTDFGMSKMLGNQQSTMSFVGTPEYLAPQIIKSAGHGITADWWSFGILIFEMLVGIPPFYNQNIQLMYELIQFGDLRFPQRNPLSPEAIDIITKLLDRNPESRLGAGGFQEVQRHPFFASVDWEALLQKRVVPPFKPKISNPMSTENFSTEFTSEEAINSVVPEHRLKMIQQYEEEFKDF